MRLRRELSDPGDALRSWRDQKHDILRQAEVRRSLIVAEDESSDSEGEEKKVAGKLLQEAG